MDDTLRGRQIGELAERVNDALSHHIAAADAAREKGDLAGVGDNLAAAHRISSALVSLASEVGYSLSGEDELLPARTPAEERD